MMKQNDPLWGQYYALATANGTDLKVVRDIFKASPYGAPETFTLYESYSNRLGTLEAVLELDGLDPALVRHATVMMEQFDVAQMLEWKQVYALRAVAHILEGSDDGFDLSIEQDPADFYSDEGDPHRLLEPMTGFVQATFPDKTIFIHSHWRQIGDGLITSMHVKGEGTKIELRWRPMLEQLVLAVVALHNAEYAKPA